MSQEVFGEQEHTLSTKRFTTAIIAGPLLEMAQTIPGLNEAMVEPFDVTNHAGNMWGGTVIAIGSTLVYSMKNRQTEESYTISEESMDRFRKRGVAMIMGATALINCVTETKWGVQHLPVAEWLGGTTPDHLDTAYSTLWAGILALAFWKKTEAQ